MINLSVSDLEKKEQAQPSSVLYDTADYPYGLKIQIDADTYKKLGFAELPNVNQKFIMHALVEVCSVYKEPGKGDAHNYSLGMQITDMELAPASESKKTEDVIYKSEG